ncbi:MAG: deoxyguanosinetriphosphate triphosphohydrolase, partial [Pseudomonadota bacterium]
AQVYDVIASTRERLHAVAPDNVAAVRRQGPLVCFSAPMVAQATVLKHFLLHKLYRHPQVMDTTRKARKVIQDLFLIYQEHPAEMQAGYSRRMLQSSEGLRVVADYIAGMTDRFAAREHERLTGERLWA